MNQDILVPWDIMILKGDICMYSIEDRPVFLKKIEVSVGDDERKGALAYLEKAKKKEFDKQIKRKLIGRKAYRKSFYEWLETRLSRLNAMTPLSFNTEFLRDAPDDEEELPIIKEYVKLMQAERDTYELDRAIRHNTLVPLFKITGSGKTDIYNGESYPVVDVENKTMSKDADFHFMKIRDALLHVNANITEAQMYNKGGRVHICIPSLYMLEEHELQKLEEKIRIAKEGK